MKAFIIALLLSTSMVASGSPLGCITQFLVKHWNIQETNDGMVHAVSIGPENTLKWVSGMTFFGVYGYQVDEVGKNAFKNDAATEVATELHHCACYVQPDQMTPTKVIYSGTCSTVG